MQLLICPRAWRSFRPASLEIIAIHSRNDFEFDLLRAHGFAFADVRTAAEEFLFYLRNHVQCALKALRLSLGEQSQVTYFRSCKQGRCCIGTSRDAGPAADTGCRIHSKVGVLFRDE